jgi:hypothetical protein
MACLFISMLGTRNSVGSGSTWPLVSLMWPGMMKLMKLRAAADQEESEQSSLHTSQFSQDKDDFFTVFFSSRRKFCLVLGCGARFRGLLDIPMGRQTYKRNTRAHRHFSNFYA